jgi:PTH1 family peptidyl-tRNA hydrolase
MTSAWLAVGLGNPGPDYATHRHSIGQRVVDELARDLGESFKRHKSLAMIAEGRFRPGTDKVIVATLTTFMNTSGVPIRALSDFFGIDPDHVIVIHDDIDLPFDTVRIKAGGGHGGQNGVRSTIAHLGADFLRVRVGVGRPSGQKDPAVHVLEPFSSTERETLPNLIADAAGAVESIVLDGLTAAQLKYHSPAT